MENISTNLLYAVLKFTSLLVLANLYNFVAQVAPGIVVKQEPTDYDDEDECDENEDNLLCSCENIEVCGVHLGREEGIKASHFFGKITWGGGYPIQPNIGGTPSSSMGDPIQPNRGVIYTA